MQAPADVGCTQASSAVARSTSTNSSKGRYPTITLLARGPSIRKVEKRPISRRRHSPRSCVNAARCKVSARAWMPTRGGVAAERIYEALTLRAMPARLSSSQRAPCQCCSTNARVGVGRRRSATVTIIEFSRIDLMVSAAGMPSAVRSARQRSN